jgi:hypothetical protein
LIFIYNTSARNRERKKQKAKQDAALKLMVQRRKSYRDGETLNNVSRETMFSYCEWYAQISLQFFSGIFNHSSFVQAGTTWVSI